MYNAARRDVIAAHGVGVFTLRLAFPAKKKVEKESNLQSVRVARVAEPMEEGFESPARSASAFSIEPISKRKGLNIGTLMSETTRMLSVKRPVVLEAILRGGALCGVLDISAAFVVYGYLGAKPVRLLQGIASGLLGPRVFDGGLPTAFLGLCLHFFIALTATCVYVFLSQWVSLLAHYVYVSGPLYGVAVYFFMQYVVIPLSALRKGPFSFKGMIIGVIIHIFCVGLPISLATRRYLHD